jgi:hypothetical protein
MKRALALGLLAALACAAPAGAAPASMTIVTHDASVSRIGMFRPSENPRLSAAIRAFGRPSGRLAQGSACRVTWRRLELKIVFANFGGTAPGQTTCTPSVGRAQSFVVRGPRFRTVAGLRVDQPATQVRALYPYAQWREGGWTLVSAETPYGEASETPVLRAFASGGKVSALSGWIGGAGD